MSRSSVGPTRPAEVKEWPNVAIIVVALLSAGAMARPSSDTSMELGSDSTRIHGGYDVKPGEYPFLVSIDDRCGGSIIGQRHIVTAAHCVDMYFSVLTGEYLTPVDTMRVKIGAHDLLGADDGQLVSIESVTIHEDYHRTDKGEPINDIAILKTWSPIAFEGKRFERGAVGSILLPMGGDDYIDGELLTVAGWGMVNRTISGDTIYRSVPSQVELPVVSLEKCQATGSLAGNATDWENQICAGVKTGEKDSCNGDSGGPLFRSIGNDEHGLIGIVSNGPKCGLETEGQLGVYTRVSKYVNWIMNNLS